SISAARTFALKYHYEVDARQELLGLGAANLLAGMFQGYPSAGGLSQSAVNDKAGARTPLALVVAALLLGILDGVIFAVVASLVMLLQRTSTPHVAFLGRIPGTNRFSDLARHPDNEPVPGVLIFRVEAALLYFNVEHILREVLQRVSHSGPSLR